MKADARFLLAWLGWVEYWAEIDDLWEQTAMLAARRTRWLRGVRQCVGSVDSVP